MISWMQKHNKYLVWTIWIATIAFIGAGVVGWGDYNLGFKGDKIAKVGNIEIDKYRYQMTYKSLYDRYNQQLQGTLDDKKAKEIGIEKQAFELVKNQTLFLNLADEYGIKTTDEEVAKILSSIPNFQTDGKFDMKIYEQYLASQNLKKRAFEDILKDDIAVNKLLTLLKTNSVSTEDKAVAMPLDISDEVAISILNPNDIKITVNEEAVKKYWSDNKNKYQHPKKYNTEILWTTTNNIDVSQAEIEEFYKLNAGKYSGQNGEKLSIEMMKPFITKEIQTSKGEKIAKRAYIDFKNSKIKPDLTLTISSQDQSVPKELIAKLENAKNGEFLKPQLINDKYATVKLVSKVESKPMTFEEAKALAMNDYVKKEQQNNLQKLAEERVKNIDTKTAQSTIWININENKTILTLGNEESLQFLQKLLTSKKERGIIKLSDKVVVYRIISQKISQNNQKDLLLISQSVSQLKNKVLESGLLEALNKKYSTKIYSKGMNLE
ncbi:MAG: peptidylprolyl isomerase [Sulfurovaceae bacterium]|nr:peptidylprolyl isomerase [Sulfurovaceae bacterium]